MQQNDKFTAKKMLLITAPDWTLMICSDDYLKVYVDGKHVASSVLNVISYINIPSKTKVIATQVTNIVGPGVFRAAFIDYSMVTDGSWKCSSIFTSGWQNIDFDDSLRPAPTTVEMNTACGGFSSSVKWLQTSKDYDSSTSTI